jgi:hypothetical protein
LPNSNFQTLTPAAPKRKWVGSLVALASVSVGGGFGVNAILNPALDGGSAESVTQTQTVTGDLIQYRYGEVQIEVTASGGKIETVTELVATADRGYDQAFALLNTAALEAQSADMGNVSGATFTSEAYKEALASALSKLQ